MRRRYGGHGELAVQHPLTVLVAFAIDDDALQVLLRDVVRLDEDERVREAAAGERTGTPAPRARGQAGEGRAEPGQRRLAPDRRRQVGRRLKVRRLVQLAQLGQEQGGRTARRPWFPGLQTVEQRQRVVPQRREPDAERLGQLARVPAGDVDGLGGGGEVVSPLVQHVVVRLPFRQPVAGVTWTNRASVSGVVLRYDDATKKKGHCNMPVVWQRRSEDGAAIVEVVGVDRQPILTICKFLTHVLARGNSPNTARAYAHDLDHLWRFLEAHELAWRQLTPERAYDLLGYLRALPSRRRGAPRGPVLAASVNDTGFRLAPSTVNRALSAVSSFYDWAILSGHFEGLNPIARANETASLWASDGHKPFLHGIIRARPTARVLRVKTVDRLPRPLETDQTVTLLGTARCRRDLALLRLMLDGGLRPGEALGLHLGDISYGRRRVTIRYREDHPRGVRSKSRRERVVDLHEAVTLEAVTAYVLAERPADAETPLLFLVGGHGRRRCEPLSYAALVRMFARACTRAGIRTPGMTPHALRHTHATRMWEMGMRELTLQKRLGHATAEATRVYTRVSDRQVVAEYRHALGLPPEPSAARNLP